MSPLSRPILFAAAAAAALATSACSPATAGSAAVVGDSRLTVAALQQDVSEILAERNDTQAGGADQTGQLQRQAVDRWVYEQLVDAAAQAKGVTVSQGDVAARIAQVKAQAGEQGYQQAVLSSAAPLEDADELVRMVVQVEKLGDMLVPSGSNTDAQAVANQRQQAVQDLIQAQAKKLDIKVNPRYGTYDPASTSVVAMQSGGLAVDPNSFDKQPSDNGSAGSNSGGGTGSGSSGSEPSGAQPSPAAS